MYSLTWHFAARKLCQKAEDKNPIPISGKAIVSLYPFLTRLLVIYSHIWQCYLLDICTLLALTRLWAIYTHICEAIGYLYPYLTRLFSIYTISDKAIWLSIPISDKAIGYIYPYGCLYLYLSRLLAICLYPHLTKLLAVYTHIWQGCWQSIPISDKATAINTHIWQYWKK